MGKVKKTSLCFYAFGSLIVLLLMSSCNTFKEIVKEEVVESITREYDTKPYQINVGEIIRARKEQKKKKKRELIENYEIEQTDSAQQIKADSTSKCKITESAQKIDP